MDFQTRGLVATLQRNEEPSSVMRSCFTNGLLLGLAACAVFHPMPGLCQNWMPTTAPSNVWQAVACSADGTKLVAGINGGAIWTSTNSGASWAVTSAGTQYWACVSSSADGRKLAGAVAYGGPLCVTTNGGSTWTVTSAPTQYWAGV